MIPAAHNGEQMRERLLSNPKKLLGIAKRMGADVSSAEEIYYKLEKNSYSAEKWFGKLDVMVDLIVVSIIEGLKVEFARQGLREFDVEKHFLSAMLDLRRCTPESIRRAQESIRIARTEAQRMDNVKKETVDAVLEIEKLLKEAKEAEIRPLITTMLKNQCVSMSEKSEKETKEDDEAADAHVDCVLSFYKSPWFRFFIDYDPKPALEQVMCPALFLFGELDTQVPLETNRTAIGDVLKKSGNNDYILKMFPKANHAFQSANTGSPSEYMSLEKKFVPGLLEFMSDWVLKRVDIVTQ